MRVSNHSGHMINFYLYRQSDKDSYGVVIQGDHDEFTNNRRPKFKPDNRVDHLEFSYNTERFEGKKDNEVQNLQLELVEGIKKLITIGDATGMPLPDRLNLSGIYKDIVREERKNNPQIMFSINKDKDKNLVAVHNISAGNLAKSLELGGLAMPSIAITKSGMEHEGFGDISLIFF